MTTPRKHWFRVYSSIRHEEWSNDQLALVVRLMAEMKARWAEGGGEDEASRVGLQPPGQCARGLWARGAP